MPFKPNYEVKPERNAYTMKAGPVGCLMLHGFLGSPTSSRAMAEYMASYGITVHCPLLPGHGELPNKLYKRTSEEWRSEAEEAYHWIQAQCDELFLMGHSMGTVLAAELAIRFDEAKGLILLAPAYKLPDERIRVLSILKYVMPWLQPLRFKRLQNLVKERILEFDPSLDLTDPALQESLPEMTKVPTGAIDEMRKILDMGKRLWPKLDYPGLVFQGLNDYAVFPDDTQHLYELLPNSDKDLVILEGSGHELMRPFDPGHAGVWAAIIEFIRKHANLKETISTSTE